jgi:precorrin-8X/cobalt-precorrin-8 methylmutase
MDLDFNDAASLAIIDRQITIEIGKDVTPAQYEIVRQVIYSTADLEYQSLLKFSSGALAKGAAAITAITPIIVDVPEIQVSIVPKLRKTFANPVYCCATTKSDLVGGGSKAARGLEILAKKYPKAILIIGQDQTALLTMMDLLNHKVIDPSLMIATPPTFIESAVKQKIQNTEIPAIYINSHKGGGNIASAIFKGLLQLTWQIECQN